MGSSTFLTDGLGKPYQFFINLPFGETMYEQHSYSENYVNPYKFNGKEMDVETGLYYYGARYYDPSTSIWMSVDPLAEKFPGWSPYNYTFNNPVIYTDPTGMAPEIEQDCCGGWNPVGGIGDGIVRAFNSFFGVNPNPPRVETVKVTTDGTRVFAEGGDSKSGSGLVTGTDRGSGSFTVGDSDFNPVNALLNITISTIAEFLASDSKSEAKVISSEVNSDDKFKMTTFFSDSTGDENFISEKSSSDRIKLETDSTDVMNSTTPKTSRSKIKSRDLVIIGADSVRISEIQDKKIE